MTRTLPRVYEEPRAHISLKHSLNPELIARYVVAVIERDNVTAFSTTESSRAYFLAIKRLLGRDWIVTFSGEYAIGVRRDRFMRTRVLGTFTRLTQVYEKSASWRDFYVHRRIFVHRATGRQYAIAAGHPPATVEMGDTWRESNPDGVRASKRGLRRQGRWVERIERRRPGIVVDTGLDTNFDHHRPSWRNRGRAMLRLDGMWDKRRPHPSIGTHGARLIDAIYANVPMTEPHISRVVPPRFVDHKAVVVTLNFAQL